MPEVFVRRHERADVQVFTKLHERPEVLTRLQNKPVQYYAWDHIPCGRPCHKILHNELSLVMNICPPIWYN